MNAEANAMRSSDEYFAGGDETATSPKSRRATKSSADSQRKVAEWNSYLPKECVAAMVAMGWDETT